MLVHDRTTTRQQRALPPLHAMIKNKNITAWMVVFDLRRYSTRAVLITENCDQSKRNVMSVAIASSKQHKLCAGGLSAEHNISYHFALRG